MACDRCLCSFVVWRFQHKREQDKETGCLSAARGERRRSVHRKRLSLPSPCCVYVFVFFCTFTFTFTFTAVVCLASCVRAQLLQPGEAPLHAVRNMTLNGDVEVRIGVRSAGSWGDGERVLFYNVPWLVCSVETAVSMLPFSPLLPPSPPTEHLSTLFLQERVQQNFHDRSITLGRPELVAKYIEPLRDPLWDRGLLHFYKSLQVCLVDKADRFNIHERMRIRSRRERGLEGKDREKRTCATSGERIGNGERATSMNSKKEGGGKKMGNKGVSL